jgi:hypothetical protein
VVSEGGLVSVAAAAVATAEVSCSRRRKSVCAGPFETVRFFGSLPQQQRGSCFRERQGLCLWVFAT